MQKYKFAIPSYKRVEKQLSLQMLKEFGYKREDIILSTQTEEDYKAYQEAYGNDCVVIYKEGHSVTDNRNALIDYFDKGQWLIMLDDDIKGFYKLEGEKLQKIESREELDNLFNGFFDYTEKNNGKIWGVYLVKNAFFMSKTISKRNIVNSCLGIIKDYRFDENYKSKEDIELCCRYLKRGYNIVRFNFVTFDVKHKQQGGCCEVWKTDENAKTARKLVKIYPNLLRLNTRREGEVLFSERRN